MAGCGQHRASGAPQRIVRTVHTYRAHRPRSAFRGCCWVMLIWLVMTTEARRSQRIGLGGDLGLVSDQRGCRWMNSAGLARRPLARRVRTWCGSGAAPGQNLIRLPIDGSTVGVLRSPQIPMRGDRNARTPITDTKTLVRKVRWCGCWSPATPPLSMGISGDQATSNSRSGCLLWPTPVSCHQR